MGVLLQGFFKMPPNAAVPSPADGDLTTAWWWDRLASQANDFRNAGFSAIWLPPVLKTSAGVTLGADGYGPFDDYDIGSKNQMGSVPTRFGSREQLQRCVAILRANGLDVYLDMVEHHRDGDPGNFVFRYRGAKGTQGIGRFPKDPLNFVPNVPRDPNLGGPARDDFPFGRELAPINGKPKGYVFNGLIDAADWLTRTLDVQGYRLDDVKGLSTDFLFPFLNSKSMAGKFAFGEFFDGNRILVNGWVFNPHGMRGRASAFDFPLRFILAAMCNNPGRFNMADLDHAGLAGISPFNAVTFVENHDTDLNSPVVTNKVLGYAYILTSEGYPCVYYRDYSTDRNCYGLKPLIDNLVWIHEKLAAGPTQQRWKDFNVFAYERLGAPGLLVALNNDPSAARTVDVSTSFGANTALHDYTGHGGDVMTAGDGTVRITVPRNDNGRGFVCYSRKGIDGGFAVQSRAVRHDFEGAGDLDLPPAENGKVVEVGRVWCDQNTALKAGLEIPGLAGSTQVELEVTRPDGTVLAAKAFTASPGAQPPLGTKTDRIGYHGIRLKAGNAPGSAEDLAYKLSVEYMGTKQLTAADLASDQPPAGGTAGKPSTDPKIVGRWDQPFQLPNVAIHTNLLPSGQVLFWGRRDQPTDSLDVHVCTPHLWDPATGKTSPTPQPALANGETINLFCSGHTFLPDGRLLVVGGHLADGNGLNQATTYDYRTNKWTPLPLMNKGRWYPTALTLEDGTALALSGSFLASGGNTPPNEVPQVWDGSSWRSIASQNGLPLYPRLHALPDGKVLMSGWLAQSFTLDTNGQGKWAPLPGEGGSRANGLRDYAPAVMYDVGKIIFIGGGNDKVTHVPTAACEVIDFGAATPAWRPTGSMHHPRRQHNGTLLPDGTVLVTGGTQGGGGPNPGFNDLTPGQPVHTAEFWDPETGQWTELSAEATDRCYHSTAILLPDATVLSAGGGEYRPDSTPAPNPPQDSHRDAQIFRPPYLFKGDRPNLSGAPAEVQYGEIFDVVTPKPQEIAQVSWIRLPSVTHAFDQNQRINFLKFSVKAAGLSVTAPDSPAICTPGHYMLFLLNKAKVPSIAKIVRIDASARQKAAVASVKSAALRPEIPSEPQMSTEEMDQAIVKGATGTHVAIGLTSKCPYGLGACWGGAYEALQGLDGVHSVRPIANANDSTADVYLVDHVLPNLEKWPDQIARTANGSYTLRGVEITIRANLRAREDALEIIGPLLDTSVELRPLGEGEKIQFDRATGTAKAASARELDAYRRLTANNKDAGGFVQTIRVTGPLRRTKAGWVLYVRDFQI